MGTVNVPPPAISTTPAESVKVRVVPDEVALVETFLGEYSCGKSLDIVDCRLFTSEISICCQAASVPSDVRKYPLAPD